MKIGIIGAPSTGKSVFSRSLSAEMIKRGLGCELIPEYASLYIQQTGAPVQAWEQLVISVGQYLIETQLKREHMVTDAAAFATYIYAERLVPKLVNKADWPKYRQLLDVLRDMARISAASYDLIFLLSHVFPPRNDGVGLAAHLSQATCKAIGRDFETYLEAERLEFHRLKANDSRALEKAMQLIEQRLVIQAPQKAPA